MSKTLAPFVKWAQREDTVLLKIELQQLASFDLNYADDSISFTGYGAGVSGLNDYAFQMKFYGEIKPSDAFHKTMGSYIDVSIPKKASMWWPRLFPKSSNYPPWLKPDFDRWETEQDSDEEIAETTSNPYLQPNGQEDLRKYLEETQSNYDEEMKEFLRYSYLTLYNIIQCIFSLYVLTFLGFKSIQKKEWLLTNAYEYVGVSVVYAQFFSFLETLNHVVKLTRGSWQSSFKHSFGRSFCCFIMLTGDVNVRSSMAVHILFIVWFTADVIRYLYLTFKLYNYSLKLVSWLRYSMWIILYPIGFSIEVLIIFLNIAFYETSSKFSLSLPNAWNISWSFPIIMRIYIACAIYGFVGLYRHMGILRRKHLFK